MASDLQFLEHRATPQPPLFHRERPGITVRIWAPTPRNTLSEGMIARRAAYRRDAYRRDADPPGARDGGVRDRAISGSSRRVRCSPATVTRTVPTETVCKTVSDGTDGTTNGPSAIRPRGASPSRAVLCREDRHRLGGIPPTPNGRRGGTPISRRTGRPRAFSASSWGRGHAGPSAMAGAPGPMSPPPSSERRAPIRTRVGSWEILPATSASASSK